MAIPDFQMLMLPTLKAISDRNEHVIRELVDKLASEFNLTDAERNELLPSGSAFTFSNRVAWAASYLKKAGLLYRPKRGCIKITDGGAKVLESNPSAINMKYLEQFPEYLAFKTSSETTVGELPKSAQVEQNKTPEEVLLETHEKLNAELAYDLLEIVKSCSPRFFEGLVVDLLVAMKYGGTRAEAAAKVVGKSGDEGIDGIIDQDRLGLDAIYIQAKRWESVVGRPEIQKFVGALQGQRAHKGVFITTSDFTKEAQEYVKNINNKVVLINGFSLAKLMIENNVGVSTAATYEVKKIDSDYFVDE